ncbi:MAG TPA: pilus assembly protein TadG-related protein, partial [Rhodocyclaceae bacterium]
MTALLMVPLAGAAGFALDLSNALLVRSDLQAKADAAALAAVGQVSTGVAEAMKMGGDGEISGAVADAKSVFLAQSTSSDYKLVSADADVVKSGNQLKAVISYKAEVPTTL